MREYVITLTGVAAFGHHGVLPLERRDGQEFLVDVDLRVERPSADDVATTVNYAELATAIVAAVGRDPVDLIETLADRLAGVCLAHRAVTRATVTVHKPHAPVGVPFSDVSVTVVRWRGRRAVLSLGSNLGDSLATLQDAVTRLAALPFLHPTGVSAVYRTVPVGGVEQDDFRNVVVVADFDDVQPEALLDATERIEGELGRVRGVRWGPRTLDIDLVALGDTSWHSPRLTLPHPRAHERAFVLVPWLDVDPDAVLPGHGRVTALLTTLDTSGVHRLADERIGLP